MLGLSRFDSARYAWLEGNKKDMLLVNSILDGYSWHDIGVKYGISPKPKRTKIKRANPCREEEKENYEKMKLENPKHTPKQLS